MNGCGSHVGYNVENKLLPNANFQGLALNPKVCMDPKIIEHEFYHAIGVEHTQERTDRDEYVKIHFENIIEGDEVQFAKGSKSGQWAVSQFGLPYDFESVMHYGANDYGKDGKRTIETYDPPKQDIIGKAQGVSDGDIMLVKKMYNCDGKKLIKYI